MLRPKWYLSLALLCGALVAPTPVYAQQSLNIYFGGFVPRGEDARVEGDVLFNNLDFFLFDLDKFKGGTAGAEWLVALNNNVEVGLGLGVYARQVPSFYADVVDENGGDIEQRLKLRIVPFTASFRLLPLGRNAPLQPYIGLGATVMSWRYTETGEFVDFDGFVFRDRFVGSGSNSGALILGGLRVPIGPVALGFEVRHQSGKGKLAPADFAGATRIDLGGFNYLTTFSVRF